MNPSSRNRVLSDTVGPTRTKQSFKGESDVNSIMRKYLSTGVPPMYVNRSPAVFGDFSSGDDYRSMMTKVVEADRAFAGLPSNVRDHCHNDPGRFLDMIFDPNRRDELVKLGLVSEAKPVDNSTEIALNAANAGTVTPATPASNGNPTDSK